MPITSPGTCTLDGGAETTRLTVDPCSAGVSGGGVAADDRVLGDVVAFDGGDSPTTKPSAASLVCASADESPTTLGIGTSCGSGL